MNADSFTKSGSKASAQVKLDNKIFGLKVNSHEMLKTAYLAQLSSQRVNLAKTKKRGDVSGGGQKPWRQKGTGRARFGSSRNPIWRGGGVAFGPSGQENYVKKLNQKTKKSVIAQSLSLAASEDRIKIVEDFAPAGGKTAAAVKLLSKMGDKSNITLIVSSGASKVTLQSTANLQNVKILDQAYLNVKDILDAHQIVFTKLALTKLTERIGNKS